MTYLTLDAVKEALKQFETFDADTQLGLLWYGYLDIKDIDFNSIDLVQH